MLHNPLDELFQDTKQELRRQKKQSSRPHQSIYSNPLNWTPGKAIQIIHITAGAVGVFREYFHKLSPTARRLLPAPAGTAVDTTELVFGEWWLHPRNSAPPGPVDTEAEARAITVRFNELMNWTEND